MKTIYCIDDQKSMLLVYQWVFGTSDLVYTYQETDDLLAALELMTPDTIICDLVMPGMDGWTLCDRLDVIAPKAEIIIATAKDQQEQRFLAERKGYKFWSKNGDINALRELVNG